MAIQAFEIADVCAHLAESADSYHEFLRVPSLSVGVYNLPAGGEDPQQPHSEDEVYYIISGSGQIHVDGADRPVKPGSIVYVEKQLVHYFHSITEDLNILVFFAPAEGSLSQNAE
jgi:mannose-6-phosphate isomerase-like protein (cupin superfamily)